MKSKILIQFVLVFSLTASLLSFSFNIAQKVQAQLCTNPSNCLIPDFCGPGRCTTWLYCNSPNSCGPYAGGAAYECRDATYCPATGKNECFCPSGGGGTPGGYCGDGTCNSGETSCSCQSDCPGTCGVAANCVINATPPGCIGFGSFRPEGTCSGGSNNGNQCEYNSHCPGGTCVGFNPCCQGAVADSNGICVCPTCTPSNPTAPSLSSPANLSTLPNNSVNLSWTQNGTWGAACPSSNNQYKLYLSLNCVPSDYINIATLNSSITSYTLNNLQWGGRYCWFVQKTNGGSNPANSPIWEFTINHSPTDTSAGFQADACGNGITGRYDSSSTIKSNPMIYNSNFSDLEGDTFTDVQLAFVPNSVFNLNYGDSGQIMQAVVNSNSLGVYVNDTIAQTIRGTSPNYFCGTGSSGCGASGFANPSAPINCSPGQVKCQSNPSLTWSPVGTGGSNITNNAGTATVLGSGTISKMTRTGNNASASFNIRFENSFPSGTYGIYLMAVTQNSDGTYVSTNATPTSNFIFKKMGTWRFDMTNPTATVVNISYVGNSFTMQWNGSDASGLKNAYSYIWADGNGSNLQDTTIGQFINPLGITSLDYPDPSNGLVSASDLAGGSVTRNYNYSGLTVNYTFKLLVEDNACNISGGTNLTAVPQAWLTTRDGIISANQGITDIKIPVGLSNTNIPDFSNPTILTSQNGVNLTTGSAISGNATLPTPASSISSRSDYTYNYHNQAATVDIRSSKSNFYDYILDRVTKNADSIVLQEPSGGTISKSGNVSSYVDSLLGSASNINSVYTIQLNSGSLSVSNLTCDRKVLFLSPNPIIINPDVRKTIDGGCIFVSALDVTIQSGQLKTPSVPLTPGGDSQYDIFEGYIITDSIFKAPSESYLAANQWDGLLVKGGVLAAYVDMDRTLNGSGNTDQPAMVFSYDPFYSVAFKDILATRYYSIREVGF